jgi:hypothetical protein
MTSDSKTRSRSAPREGRVTELVCEDTKQWRDVCRVCRLSTDVAGARQLEDGSFVVLDETRFAYFKRSMRAKEPAECPNA